MREYVVAKEVRVVEVQRPKARRKPQPERVADRLKAERVEGRLRSAPMWRLSPDAGFLRRTRRFPTPEEALLYASFVEALAKSRGVPVNIKLKGRKVEVILHGERIRRGWKPLTEQQLDLAVALS